MKKALLLFFLTTSLGCVNAQNLLSEGFDDISLMLSNGWVMTNQSVTKGNKDWFQGSPNVFAAYQGVNTNSYVGASIYNVAMTGSNTISNWFVTPVVSLQNGDVISFYTKTQSVSGKVYPDRLQLRISKNGDATLLPSGGTEDLGDFTSLVLSVNPNLTSSGYPLIWTKYSYTVGGLASATDCKIAFRYYVTNAGVGASNGNYIGVDTFSVDRPAAGTQEFFASNFSLRPNPVNDIFNLSSKNGAAIENVKVFDINGRMVNEMTVSQSNEVQVNISDLNTGVYFVKVQSESGVGTSKIVKR